MLMYSVYTPLYAKPFIYGAPCAGNPSLRSSLERDREQFLTGHSQPLRRGDFQFKVTIAVSVLF